jgi:SAM-dependent methyltransferase
MGLRILCRPTQALSQIARVLVPGGRLILRVWRALARQPSYVALLNALERQLGRGASAPIRAAFALSDPTDLRGLVAGAGYSGVRLRITTNLLRFPSLEQYLFGYLAATPVAAQVTLMDDRGRAALLGEVVNALQSYIDDDGLAAPVENHVVVAQK